MLSVFKNLLVMMKVILTTTVVITRQHQWRPIAQTLCQRMRSCRATTNSHPGLLHLGPQGVWKCTRVCEHTVHSPLYCMFTARNIREGTDSCLHGPWDRIKLHHEVNALKHCVKVIHSASGKLPSLTQVHLYFLLIMTSISSPGLWPHT